MQPDPDPEPDPSKWPKIEKVFTAENFFFQKLQFTYP